MRFVLFFKTENVNSKNTFDRVARTKYLEIL